MCSGSKQVSVVLFKVFMCSQTYFTSHCLAGWDELIHTLWPFYPCKENQPVLKQNSVSLKKSGMQSENTGNEIKVKYLYLQVSLALRGKEGKILEPSGTVHHLLLTVTKSKNS